MPRLSHFLALTLLSFGLSGCVGLLDSPPSGSSAAVNYINGTITTGPMGKMPPLAQRGVHRIGLVVDMKPECALQTVGITMFGNRTAPIPGPALITDADIVALFQTAYSSQTRIELIDLSALKAQILPALKISSWDGSGSLAASPALVAQLADCKARGIDALLIVREQRLSDFMFGTNQIFDTKGVYNRLGQYQAFGGFAIRLIDVNTRKDLPHTAYVQAASVPIALSTWKPQFDQYTEEEQRLIREGLKQVFADNVQESILMLKAAAP